MTQTQALNNYRSTFILDTRGYEEPMESLIEKIKTTLTQLGCEIEQTNDLGVKEFARVTDPRFPRTNYIQYQFKATPEAPQAIREKFKLDRTVYRIFIEKDKR